MEILKTTLLGLFFGTFGTMLGGVIGIRFQNASKKFLSSILALASGLMTAIACFDLIPEAMEIAGIRFTLLGILAGILGMLFCDRIVERRFQAKEKQEKKGSGKFDLLKTGIIISIGLALHNIPEGLAIGSGFDASIKLGLSLAVAIAIHDIPEGVSMAIPMKSGGMKSGKILFYIFLSGIATGLGAFFGAIVGKISEQVIAMCLAFAGGAMLYIVSGELSPEYNHLYTGKLPSIFNIIGFVLGILATTL